MLTITEEMIHAAERTLIRYALAEDDEIKPADVADAAIEERLADLRKDDEAGREDDPSLASLDDVFGAMLTAALNAATLIAAAADDSMPVAAPSAEAPIAKPCPEGFHWIGQSFAFCDQCGLPAWEHEGISGRRESMSSPYDDSPWVLKPWAPGEREACRVKWDPALAACLNAAEATR